MMEEMNISASKEDIHILEAMIIGLREQLRISDEKLKTSREQEHGLECELEISLLTSRQMPVELI